MDTSKLFTYLINVIAISFSTKGSKTDFSAKVKQTKSETTEKQVRKPDWRDYHILEIK